MFVPRNVFVILILSLFCGCIQVGPTFQPPQVAVPNPAYNSNTQPSQNPIRSGWAVGLTPQLDSLLSAAALNNNSIKSQGATVLEAEAKLNAARGGFFPVVGITGSGAHTDRRGDSSANFNGGGQLSWELDIWGRVRSEVKAAKFDSQEAQELLKGAKLSVASSLVENYLVLLAYDRGLEIAKNTLAYRERYLELQRARYENGALALIDLKQSEAARDSAAVIIPQYQANISATERVILNLIAATDSAILIPRPSLEEVLKRLPPVKGQLSYLVARPDVQAAAARYFSSEARSSAAFRSMLPKVSFEGLINWQSDSFTNWIRNANRLWSLGGEAAWTAFSGGAIYQSYRAAEAREKRAYADFAGVLIAAANETQGARERLAAARAAVDLRRTELNSLNEGLRLANILYTEGRVAFLTVLDAERESLVSELGLVSAEIEMVRQYVQLFKSLAEAPAAFG